MNRIALPLAVVLLAISAVLVTLAFLPSNWLEGAPEPPAPLKVSALVTPADSRARALPKGGRLSHDGRLTILNVPGIVGRPVPWEKITEPLPPLKSEPLPAGMAAGIRALFRIVPPPPSQRDRLVIRTLERNVQQGRLLLVDGCFRFGSPDGPVAVLPFGTRLGLSDGYLIVGSPGFPALQTARVGEEVFWEGERQPIRHEPSLRLIERYCGPGPAVLVIPESATVQQARNDGLAASEWMQTYGVGDWEEALAAVRECRERWSRGLAHQFPDQPKRVMVDNMCARIPPPLVTDPAECPAGSSLRAGVCITAEGYRRPVPS